jgi:hypothetical protein
METPESIRPQPAQKGFASRPLVPKVTRHPVTAGLVPHNVPKTSLLISYTSVLRAYTSGPFTSGCSQGKLIVGDRMRPGSTAANQRRGNRTKAVLPVRVKGKDSSGTVFEELVHTLDVTAEGVRLGAVRRELNLLDEVTVFFRQRKMQFRVVWIKKLKGTSEFHIGLQAITQERDSWGVSFPECKTAPVPQRAVSQATGVA